VVVEVQILPAPFERTLHGLSVRAQNLVSGFALRATPPTVDVGLRGTRDGLSRLGAEDVSVFVDAVGLGAGEYILPVHAESTRAEAGVVHIEPSKLQVRIASDKN
jgi:hypothetical protein